MCNLCFDHLFKFLMRAFSILLFFFVIVFAASNVSAQMLTGYWDDDVRADNARDIERIKKNVEKNEPRLVAPMPGQILTAPQNAVTSTTSMLTGYNNQKADKDAPVDFQADDVRYDENARIVTASGNVIMVQDGRILRADQVRYDLTADKVYASGNVVLNEVNGDIHLSQEVELQNKMKNGFVESLHTYLNDGSRFTADHGVREGGTKTVMSDATYTACEPCESDPEGSVPWRLRASEVTHDEENARVQYKHARFEVFDVPVFYTPYFSHADGSVKQKSGFLAPSFGFNSDLGAFIENSYYWGIAPDKDMTVGLVAMTNQAPLGLLEYRQHWADASLEARGGVTYSDYTDSVGDVGVPVDDE